MRWESNLSSKGVKFKRSRFILFTLEQTVSFPLVRFKWQVEQIHLVLSILVVLVIHAWSKVSANLGYLFASHFLTDEQYHNYYLSQWAHTYSGPHHMLAWKLWMTFVIVCTSCAESWHLNSCISFIALQLGLLVNDSEAGHGHLGNWH